MYILGIRYRFMRMIVIDVAKGVSWNENTQLNIDIFEFDRNDRKKNTLNLLQHVDWWNMSNMGILYVDRQTQIIDHSNPSERECSNEELRR